MHFLILVLIGLNVLVGDFSWSGRELVMSTHPIVIRLRFFAVGLVTALLLTGYEWNASSVLGWSAIVLLAATVARFPVRAKHDAPATGTDPTVSSPS